MAVRRIVIDIPEKVPLSKKTDEKAFGYDNTTIFWWRK